MSPIFWSGLGSGGGCACVFDVLDFGWREKIEVLDCCDVV